MSDPGLEQLRERLVSELATLADREFLVAGEPRPPAPERPRGLFRRKPDPPAFRFVQFLRMDDTVMAECVGATAFGGYVDISEGDQERLRALGWQAPGDTSEPDWGAPNYRIYAPRAETARLAQLGVETLEVLGLVAASEIEVERGH